MILIVIKFPHLIKIKSKLLKAHGLKCTNVTVTIMHIEMLKCRVVLYILCVREVSLGAHNKVEKFQR